MTLLALGCGSERFYGRSERCGAWENLRGSQSAVKAFPSSLPSRCGTCLAERQRIRDAGVRRLGRARPLGV